ncbi:MAG: NAD+ synthase [Phycisphaerales bacterium]
MKIALAQINPIVGDLAANTKLIRDAIVQARSIGARIVVFPELSICGYPPRDLLNVEDFTERCLAAADAIGLQDTNGITIVIGTPDRVANGHTANAVAVYQDNTRVGTYHKRLLPTYDVFDEDRYFEPGDQSLMIEVDGTRIGFAICEDLWRGQDAGFAARYSNAADPMSDLAEAGIDVLVVPSASPFVLGKHERHRSIIAKQANSLGVPVISVNQCGGNDDLIFDGRSCAIDPDGKLLREAAPFTPDLVLVDTDKHSESSAKALSWTDERLVIEALTVGVRDYLGKCGFKAACLGLSGGIDSALTAAIACRAIGPENVLGAAMPGPFSSEGSITDAYDLADRLGMRCITMPIANAYEGHRSILNAAFRAIDQPELGDALPDVAQENLQSRARGALMMGLSNRTGSILLTTGNKSEVAVGYCTLYGDMNGGLAVISDVPKTLVFRVCSYLNEHAQELGFNHPPIPVSTIEKPPSAELAPGQLDTDSLPPYEVLDEIIERHVERRQSSDAIIEKTRFDAQLVTRICRLIDLNEYKRRQYAVGLKVTHVAFGPGRRMPIAQRWIR